MKKRLAVLFTICVGLTGCAGCTRVGPGYVGIKVTLAGTGKGVSDIPAQTGWVTYNIFTESVLEYPTFVQNAVWTASPHEGQKGVNEEITFTTKQGMKVSADIALAYTLVGDKAPHFYVKFRNDDLDGFTHGFMRNLARDKFDSIGGRYSVDEIVGDNGPFLIEVRKEFQKDLDKIGIQLEQFGFIGAPRPPQSVIDSINLKVQATQVAIQKQNEIVQVEADAKKAIAQADGEARSTLVRAEAQAQANRKLAESLTPALVEYRKIDKWDGKLPQVSGSGGGIIMSLPNRAGAGQ